MLNVRHAHSLRYALTENRFDASCCIERIEYEHRVIPLSRGRHVRGWHPVRRGHGAIAFESKLERDVISGLAGYPGLIRMKSQPITVSYRHHGGCYCYTPDLLVRLSEVPDELAALGFGHDTYVEVKPYLRALEQRDPLARKFAVLEAATDLPVVLMTELDLPSIHREIHHGA